MKKLIALFALSLVACTDPDNASRVLREQGYTEIRITGYNMMACSDDDHYHTGFTAKSPNGTQVNGTICAGLLFKNSTIRFE